MLRRSAPRKSLDYVNPRTLKGSFVSKYIEPANPALYLPERSLKGKRILVTGGSRGIGLAIALRAAQDGAMVAIAAKSVEENPVLGGTIYSAAEEINKAGGVGLPIQVDIRSEEAVQRAVDKVVSEFGGLDILINNASAIGLTSTAETDMKRYDLMHTINARGTYMVTKYCHEALKKGVNPHILTLSPPLNLDPKWLKPHVAYTMSKYGMSMCVVGHAEEFKVDKIAVNGLWPRTTIATAAVSNLLGGDALMKMSRTPQIMAGAAHCVLTRRSDLCTGNLFLDDEVLASEGRGGEEALSKYAYKAGAPLVPDLYVF